MQGNSQGTYTADLFSHGVDTLVSTTEHHLVDNNLLSAQDNAIGADNSACGAEENNHRDKVKSLNQKYEQTVS